MTMENKGLALIAFWLLCINVDEATAAEGEDCPENFTRGEERCECNEVRPTNPSNDSPQLTH